MYVCVFPCDDHDHDDHDVRKVNLQLMTKHIRIKRARKDTPYTSTYPTSRSNIVGWWSNSTTTLSTLPSPTSKTPSLFP